MGVKVVGEVGDWIDRGRPLGSVLPWGTSRAQKRGPGVSINSPRAPQKQRCAQGAPGRG